MKTHLNAFTLATLLTSSFVNAAGQQIIQVDNDRINLGITSALYEAEEAKRQGDQDLAQRKTQEAEELARQLPENISEQFLAEAKRQVRAEIGENTSPETVRNMSIENAKKTIIDAVFNVHEFEIIQNLNEALKNYSIAERHARALTQANLIYQEFWSEIDYHVRQILNIGGGIAPHTDFAYKISKQQIKERLLEAVIQFHQAKIDPNSKKLVPLWQKILDAYRNYLGDEEFFLKANNAIASAQAFEGGIQLLANLKGHTDTHHIQQVENYAKASGSFFTGKDASDIHAEPGEINLLSDIFRISPAYKKGDVYRLSNPEKLGLPQGTEVVGLFREIQGDGVCYMYCTGAKSRPDFVNTVLAALKDPIKGDEYRIMAAQGFVISLIDLVNSLEMEPEFRPQEFPRQYIPYLNQLFSDRPQDREFSKIFQNLLHTFVKNLGYQSTAERIARSLIKIAVGKPSTRREAAMDYPGSALSREIIMNLPNKVIPIAYDDENLLSLSKEEWEDLLSNAPHLFQELVEYKGTISVRFKTKMTLKSAINNYLILMRAKAIANNTESEDIIRTFNRSNTLIKIKALETTLRNALNIRAEQEITELVLTNSLNRLSQRDLNQVLDVKITPIVFNFNESPIRVSPLMSLHEATTALHTLTQRKHQIDSGRLTSEENREHGFSDSIQDIMSALESSITHSIASLTPEENLDPLLRALGIGDVFSELVHVYDHDHQSVSRELNVLLFLRNYLPDVIHTSGFSEPLIRLLESIAERPLPEDSLLREDDPTVLKMKILQTLFIKIQNNNRLEVEIAKVLGKPMGDDQPSYIEYFLKDFYLDHHQWLDLYNPTDDERGQRGAAAVYAHYKNIRIHYIEDNHDGTMTYQYSLGPETASKSYVTLYVPGHGNTAVLAVPGQSLQIEVFLERLAHIREKGLSEGREPTGHEKVKRTAKRAEVIAKRNLERQNQGH